MKYLNFLPLQHVRAAFKSTGTEGLAIRYKDRFDVFSKTVHKKGVSEIFRPSSNGLTDLLVAILKTL